MRAISDSSRAHISIKVLDDVHDVAERNITLLGPPEAVSSAAVQIFDVISADPRNLVYLVPGVNYGGGGGGGGSLLALSGFRT